MEQVLNVAEGLGGMSAMKNSTEVSAVGIEEGEERIFKYDLQLSSSEDIKLFEVLRKIRMQLAQQYRKDTFQILSNRTLRLLAACKPTIKEQILQIHGIKEVKYEQYGEAFLEVIRSEGYGIADFVSPENFINPLWLQKQMNPHVKTYQKKDERRWEELENRVYKMQKSGLKNEDIKAWLDSYYELEKAKEFQKYQEILLSIQEKINELKLKVGI